MKFKFTSLCVLIHFLLTAQIVPPLLPQNLCEASIRLPDTVGYKRITVGKASGNDFQNLQTALDSAKPGTILLLAPDTFFSPAASGAGGFLYYLFKNKPNNTNGKWIILMPQLFSLLPPSGQRLDPEAQTGFTYYPKVRNALPKFPTMAKNGYPALAFDRLANHYMLIGLDVFTNLNYKSGNGDEVHYGNLIEVGDGGGACCAAVHLNGNMQDSLYEVPNHITFDRCYVHCEKSTATGKTTTVKRGISLNSASTAVVNCCISNIVCEGFEASSIAGWNGPGPFRIINNYLESSGINFIYGGAEILIPQVPADLEFKNNYCYKQPRWKVGSANWDGNNYCVKNNFEIKHIKRALIEGNVFENCWQHCAGQKGFALTLTLRSIQGGPLSEMTDVIVQNNLIKNTQQGVAVLGRDYYDTVSTSVPQANRMKIYNNLFLLDTSAQAGFGVYQFTDMQNLIVDHNTAINQKNDRPLNIYWSPAMNGTNKNISFTNNLHYHNNAGIAGDDGASAWENALFSVWPDVTDSNMRFNRNVMARTSTSHSLAYLSLYCYPSMFKWKASKNYWPSSDSIMFVDSTNGRNNIMGFALSSTSPFKKLAFDGEDIGADISKIKTAIDQYVDNCLSLTTYNFSAQELNVLLYPNPTNGIVTINTWGSNGINQLVIFNSIGQEVFSKNFSEPLITTDLKGVRPGIYYAMVTAGEKRFTQKVILRP